MQLAHRIRIAITVFGLYLTLLSTTAAFENTGDESASDKADSQAAIVLKDATIHSMGAKGSYVGSILVKSGKIEAIGESVEVPDDAKVYDLKGFHLTPGLIESRGKLWLTPTAISESNSKAELKVVDAIDPWNEDWKELAAQGVTSVYVQPNSTSSVGGLGAVLRVGPHGSVDDIVMKDEVAVQVSIGTKGKSSKDRYAQIQALEKLLKSAQDKDKKKDDAKDKDKKDKDADKDSEEDKKDADKDEDKDDEEEEKDGDKADKDKKDEDEKDEKKDVTKEIFKRVLKRELPLFVEVHHSDSLKRVIALAKEFNIRVVLDGLTKVASCADDLADCNHPMVLGPYFESTTPPEYRKDGGLEWFADCDSSEKLWTLSAFPASARGSQLLRVNAAYAVGQGVDSGEVLKALTANAARMLGVSDHVGTLEKGKQADIAVFAGDPLDSSSAVRLVISHGQVTFENEVSPAESKDFAEAVALPQRLPKRYVVSTSRMLRDGKLSPGAMVVVDGKISIVADQAGAKATIKTKDGSVNDELEVFDLGDTIVTPGLVIAHSSLGQAAAINDSSESDASHLRAVDAFDPTTKKAKETLAAGFVHIGVAPGTSNTSSGAMGHVRLGVGDYVVSPAIANQFVLASPARNTERFPASLNGQVRMISDLFGGSLVDSRVYLSKAVADSVAEEKLACIKEVANGKRKSIFLANDKVEIRSVIALAKNNNIEAPTLASSGALGDFAEKLGEHRIGLLVTPIGANEYNQRAMETKEVVEAGASFGFVGDSAEQVRTTASMLAAAGVPADKVLAGLTEAGASLVGMENVGLKAGAKADFVVWSASPVNLGAKPLNVVVDGKPVSKK
jgi:imidazolonepropionase-like amidohydrolase